MVTLLTTKRFDNWFKRLRDKAASARIKARLRRIELGNPGDIRPVGGGVSEMRIHYGPGYRVYLIERGIEVIVLLCGGDKSSQQKDIETARRMALQLKENDYEQA